MHNCYHFENVTVVAVQIVGADNAAIVGHSDMSALVRRHVAAVIGLFRHNTKPVICIVAVESNLGLVSLICKACPL